jgi:hypothetical protein
MAVRTSSLNPVPCSSGTSVLPAIVATRTCLALLVGLSLTACQPWGERPLPVEGLVITDGMRPSIAATMAPDAHAPRTRARSHVLFGIDFSRPLKLPQCARYYNSFDRPDKTCVYLRSLDHKPFKIEFRNGAIPDFLKWNSALVATDHRGRPDMLRFDIDDAPAHRGRAVDAMLETFGPPTSVENSGGTSKVGTWQHDDYVIQYFFDPNGGAIVQMETKKFHDAPPAVSVAADEANPAKW